MARKNTVKLLLSNGSANDSERLVALFRRAGKVARAQRVANLDELTGALDAGWDLLIIDTSTAIPADEVLAALAKATDAPPALVIADAELQPLFEAGARDVIAPGDDQRLVCAAFRELDHRDLSRRHDETLQALAEAEQRNALLLGESARAIAYVTDGMICGASPSFAERFGYPDGEAVDCLPFIDLIATSAQDQVKAALKSQDGSAVLFTGISANGEPFEALLQLTASTFDGEPCIQVTVSESDDNGAAPGVTAEREASGLFTAGWFAANLGSNGSLLVLAIDNFPLLRRQLGYRNSLAVTTAVGQLIANHAAVRPAAVARIADDALGLQLLMESQQALELATELCHAIAEHIVEFDGQSLQCTVSASVANAATADSGALLDSAFTAIEALRDEANNSGIGNTARLFQAAAAARPRSGVTAEVALQDALDENRFQLLFQPIISLRGGRGDHYETLLRLQGEDDALELPDNLLGQLTVDPANARLDRWVLIEATKRLAESREQGHDTRLVINLQASALLDEGLIPWLGVALRAADLPADSVVLQLREADVITYLKPARQFVDAVRQLGCRLSLAGFGRALDPLKTLKSVPVDMVQLDSSFSRDLQNGGDAAPLKALVSEISVQEMKVIIPFVENAAVLATLWQVGADYIQGHYLQPPGREMNYEFADIA